MSRSLRLLGVLGLAIAAGAVLVIGGGDLQPADAGRLAGWREWAASVDPVTLTIGIVRGLALVGAAWTAAACLAQLALLAHPSARLRRSIDRVSPAVVRVAAGSALTVAVLTAPAAAAAAGDGDPHRATMRPLVAEPAGAPPTTPSAGAPPTTTTTTAPRAAVPPAAPPAPAPAPAARPVAPAPDVEPYVVERADSLWSIAEEVLTERLGRPPREREVVGYWRAVIEANADRLVVPGNADLIYPGQELRLPA